MCPSPSLCLSVYLYLSLSHTRTHGLTHKVDMGAGHFSASDRYLYLREAAFDTAFLVRTLGLPHARM